MRIRIEIAIEHTDESDYAELLALFDAAEKLKARIRWVDTCGSHPVSEVSA